MENPNRQVPGKSKKVWVRAGIIVVAVLCLVGVKALLGTRTMMHLHAQDIDRIEVSVTPPGTVLTATGADVSDVVALLSQAVTYGPKEPVAGQAVDLTIYKLDGSVQQVVVCGDYLEVDGRGYRLRESDGEKIDAWAASLAQSQSVMPG